MAWSWTPMPRRLLRDHRVLRLSRPDRAVLLSLYLGVDEHGRFNADEMSMRCVLGLVDGEVLGESIDRLCDHGLVHLFLHKGDPYGVIDGFDEDLGADIQKRRPASTLPSPPPDVWEAARCSGLFKGGKHEPDGDRIESGHEPDANRVPSDLNKRDKREERKESKTAPGLTGNGDSRQAALLAQMATIKGDSA